MKKINLLSSNKDKALLLTFLVVIFTLSTIIIPLIFINYISQSIVGNYLTLNLEFILFSIFVLLYFIYTGIFMHRITIDPYVITIASFRTISSFFTRKDYIDISHLMLKEYAFFDRPFTFNRILMIKIKTENDRVIAKRFTLSLLSNKEKQRISEVLDQILVNNKNS